MKKIFFILLLLITLSGCSKEVQPIPTPEQLEAQNVLEEERHKRRMEELALKAEIESKKPESVKHAEVVGDNVEGAIGTAVLGTAGAIGGLMMLKYMFESI